MKQTVQMSQNHTDFSIFDRCDLMLAVFMLVTRPPPVVICYVLNKVLILYWNILSGE